MNGECPVFRLPLASSWNCPSRSSFGKGMAPQPGWAPRSSVSIQIWKRVVSSSSRLIFGVHDPAAGAHHLDVAGVGAALVPDRILVGDGAGADIGDDFHVAVRMRREAGLRSDAVVVPDADPAPAHAGRVVIIGEAEMVAGVEPAMVGMAERMKGRMSIIAANVRPNRAQTAPSSVTPCYPRFSAWA